MTPDSQHIPGSDPLPHPFGPAPRRVAGVLISWQDPEGYICLSKARAGEFRIHATQAAALSAGVTRTHRLARPAGAWVFTRGQAWQLARALRRHAQATASCHWSVQGRGTPWRTWQVQGENGPWAWLTADDPEEERIPERQRTRQLARSRWTSERHDPFQAMLGEASAERAQHRAQALREWRQQRSSREDTALLRAFAARRMLPFLF